MRGTDARRGFSLPELLVVVGIIAILATAALWNARGIRQRARLVQASSHGATVAQTLARYFTTYITVTPPDLMQMPDVQNLPAPPTAPAGAPALTAARSCAGTVTLPDPSGNPSPYSWPAAPNGVACSFGYLTTGGVSRIAVITWAEGLATYYVDGRKP